MGFRKDIIRFSEGFEFNISKTGVESEKSGDLHFHDCLEINYILEGSGENVIENSTFQALPGNIYIINNLEHHMAFSKEGLVMLVLVFNPEFILDLGHDSYGYLAPFYNKSLCFTNQIEESGMYYEQIKDLILAINTEWQEKQEGYKLAVKGLLLHLLAILYRGFKAKANENREFLDFKKSYLKIRNAISYIHENYKNEILLKDIAKKAMMNKTYFCTCFKNVMQETVFSYINRLRVSDAVMLLKTTDKTVTEISLELGFSSLSYFNRIFKSVTLKNPSVYRKSENSANKTK